MNDNNSFQLNTYFEGVLNTIDTNLFSYSLHNTLGWKEGKRGKN